MRPPAVASRLVLVNALPNQMSALMKPSIITNAQMISPSRISRLRQRLRERLGPRRRAGVLVHQLHHCRGVHPVGLHLALEVAALDAALQHEDVPEAAPTRRYADRPPGRRSGGRARLDAQWGQMIRPYSQPGAALLAPLHQLAGLEDQDASA